MGRLIHYASSKQCMMDHGYVFEVALEQPDGATSFTVLINRICANKNARAYVDRSPEKRSQSSHNRVISSVEGYGYPSTSRRHSSAYSISSCICFPWHRWVRNGEITYAIVIVDFREMSRFIPNHFTLFPFFFPPLNMTKMINSSSMGAATMGATMRGSICMASAVTRMVFAISAFSTRWPRTSRR